MGRRERPRGLDQDALGTQDPPEAEDKPEESDEGKSSPTKSEGTQSDKTGDGDEEEEAEENIIFDLIRRGKVRAAEELCRTHAFLDARDKLGNSPLHVAAETGE